MELDSLVEFLGRNHHGPGLEKPLGERTVFDQAIRLFLQFILISFGFEIDELEVLLFLVDEKKTMASKLKRRFRRKRVSARMSWGWGGLFCRSEWRENR